MSEKKLEMRFDPRTIEHLGIKMYSRLPNAIAELIANAYDACARTVFVQLNDSDNENKSIVIEDDGEGMTFNDINEKFLIIGRNRRDEGEKESNCGRIATGKKGLGKLAFFGIGQNIEIESCKNGEKTTFTLKWEDLKNTKGGKNYEPESKLEPCAPDMHGTKITLTKLKRKTEFDFNGLKISLAKLFNFSDEFEVLIQKNNSEAVVIDNKLKFDGITPEFEWKIPESIDTLLDDDYAYNKKNEISGVIITTEKPIIPGMRGITLFANGRMVNSSEFFGSSESSHFFSYTTGWLDVDFVDNWDEDVISTNRQSLDWENEKTIKLKEFLKDILAKIHYDWRNKRKGKRRKVIQEKTNIKISSWFEALPENIKNEIETIVENVDNSELTEKEQIKTIGSLYSLIPEYPNLHWRHLHPEIRKVSKSFYVKKEFYTAFAEGCKRYCSVVRKKTNLTGYDRDIMVQAFKLDGHKLSVTRKYSENPEFDFEPKTIQNIQDGQRFLSEGVVAGGRNILAHEELEKLGASGLFSEEDCLDFLSVLSHLFKRFDESEKV